MNQEAFIEYATSPNLTVDEVFTIEMLIDFVESRLPGHDWDAWSKRIDARKSPNYRPAFKRELLRPAVQELSKRVWISLQDRSNQRPIRRLDAFRFFEKVTTLVISDNEVTDLTPLAACTALRNLYTNRNAIEDLSALVSLPYLEELEIADNPIADFSPLEPAPALKSLTISADQIPAFSRVANLSKLEKLELHGGTFTSFEGWPEMPNLRVLRGAAVDDLRGLEKFLRVENVIGMTGKFTSLQPLEALTRLTHIHVVGGFL